MDKQEIIITTYSPMALEVLFMVNEPSAAFNDKYPGDKVALDVKHLTAKEGELLMEFLSSKKYNCLHLLRETASEDYVVTILFESRFNSYNDYPESLMIGEIKRFLTEQFPEKYEVK